MLFSGICQRRVVMGSDLFDLNYSDALISEIKNIKNPKVRKVFLIYLEQMEKKLEENPEDYDLTFEEFMSAKMIKC